MTVPSGFYVPSPLPWCVTCMEHPVLPHLYECPCCDTTPPKPIPEPRMALDRPTPVATSGGEM